MRRFIRPYGVQHDPCARTGWTTHTKHHAKQLLGMVEIAVMRVAGGEYRRINAPWYASAGEYRRINAPWCASAGANTGA